LTGPTIKDFVNAKEQMMLEQNFAEKGLNLMQMFAMLSFRLKSGSPRKVGWQTFIEKIMFDKKLRGIKLF
jgi:hypothetical protein